MHYTDNLNKELADTRYFSRIQLLKFKLSPFYAFLFLHFSTPTILLHFFLLRYIRS